MLNREETISTGTVSYQKAKKPFVKPEPPPKPDKLKKVKKGKKSKRKIAKDPWMFDYIKRKIDLMEKEFDTIVQEMINLETKFFRKFRPLAEVPGYVLWLNVCGQERCNSCPHGFYWVPYSWQWVEKVDNKGRSKVVRAPAWGKPVAKLPKSFYETRSKATVVEFTKYAEKAKELEERKKKIVQVREKIYRTLHLTTGIGDDLPASKRRGKNKIKNDEG